MMNLNKQGRLFDMGMLPVFKTVPGHEKWTRIYGKPMCQNLETNFIMSFIHRMPEKRDSVTYFAFCFPFSYKDCQDMLEKYDEKFEHCQSQPDKCSPDDIYYHRELLCHSLDRRRVDLITISSYSGINYRREPRFDPDHLFPKSTDSEEIVNRRPFSFDNKKVYILTSRVHPGETPACKRSRDRNYSKIRLYIYIYIET